MDGSSISLMEAMASGLPAITADAGGNREWIRTGWNGWLVTSRNINGFASAILQCADLDLAERSAIGSRNRDAIQTRGDWKKNSQRLLDLYESLQTHAGAKGGKRLEGRMA
jgi:glycosyltransferase involved in cell wall biosynthesis